MTRRRQCYGGILKWTNEAKEAKETKEERYAVVKGRQTGIWSFPKGHAKQEEESMGCARREIREETGLTLEEEPIKSIRLKGTVYFIFEVKEEYVLKPEDTFEIEETRWVTPDELGGLRTNIGIKEFLERRERRQNRKKGKGVEDAVERIEDKTVDVIEE
jgi:8-oxo-dGTP diphosphatase